MSTTSQSRETWEMEIIDRLEEELDISTSDAQGTLDMHDFLLCQSWGLGLSAEAVAEKICDAEG